MGCNNLELRANKFADFNHRPANLHFPAYVRQFLVSTLLMNLSFSIRFQFDSCYTIVLMLNMQESDSGLPLAVMNNCELILFPYGLI